MGPRGCCRRPCGTHNLDPRGEPPGQRLIRTPSQLRRKPGPAPATTHAAELAAPGRKSAGHARKGKGNNAAEASMQSVPAEPNKKPGRANHIGTGWTPTLFCSKQWGRCHQSGPARIDLHSLAQTHQTRYLPTGVAVAGWPPTWPRAAKLQYVQGKPDFKGHP